MKAKINDWSTDIFLNKEEVEKICKPGCGPDTCIWLVVGANGFECTCLHKPHALVDRFEKGLTTAKRDGCDTVNNFNPMTAVPLRDYYPGIEVEIPT